MCSLSTKDSVNFVVEFNIFTFCSEAGLPWALGCWGETVIPSTLSLSETLTQPGALECTAAERPGSVGASFQSAQQKTQCSFSCSLSSLQDWWVHSAPDSAHSELIGYTYVKSPDFYQHFPKFLFSNCYKNCSLGEWGKSVQNRSSNCTCLS